MGKGRRKRETKRNRERREIEEEKKEERKDREVEKEKGAVWKERRRKSEGGSCLGLKEHNKSQISKNH